MASVSKRPRGWLRIKGSAFVRTCFRAVAGLRYSCPTTQSETIRNKKKQTDHSTSMLLTSALFSKMLFPQWREL